MWTSHKNVILLYGLMWTLWISRVTAVNYEKQPDQPYEVNALYEPQISKAVKGEEKLYAKETDPQGIWEVYNIDSTEEDSQPWPPEFSKSEEEVNILPQSTLPQPDSHNFNEELNFPKTAYSNRFHKFHYDDYGTIAKRDKSQRKNNIKVFHLLGIFSRRHNQVKQQKKHEEKLPSPSSHFSSSKARKHTDNLQALAYTSRASNSGNQTSEDSKRTIFISQGWAPSGRTENLYQNEKPVSKTNNIKDTNMYAFTSNHWGPLGKRSKPALGQFPKKYISRFPITSMDNGGIVTDLSGFNVKNAAVAQLHKILYMNLLRKILEAS